jgi:hypothetical protein
MLSAQKLSRLLEAGEIAADLINDAMWLRKTTPGALRRLILVTYPISLPLLFALYCVALLILVTYPISLTLLFALYCVARLIGFPLYLLIKLKGLWNDT